MVTGIKFNLLSKMVPNTFDVRHDLSSLLKYHFCGCLTSINYQFQGTTWKWIQRLLLHMHQASTKWGLLERMWRSINRIVLTFWCLAVSFLCNIHVTYLIQWIYWHLWGDKNRWNLCNMCMWIWVWYVKIGWNIFKHVSYHTSPNTSHSISWCQHPPVHSRRYLSAEIYISKGKVRSTSQQPPTATGEKTVNISG